MLTREELIRQAQQQLMNQPVSQKYPSQLTTPQQTAPQQAPSLLDRIGGKFNEVTSNPNFRDNFILAMQNLSHRPNQQLMQMAQQNIKDRKANKMTMDQANKTIEFLRSKGVPESELQALMKNPQMLMAYAQEVLKKSFEKPKAPISAIQEYNFAKQQGFDGTFEEWTMKKAQLQGGVKLTEGEGKSTGYLGRMSPAHDVITQFGDEALSLGQTLAGGVPVIGNYMVSENYQRLKNAQVDFLMAVLRKESGGTITEEEMATYGPVYFPQAGDNPSVIEQKKKNRERQIEAMKLTAGKGVSQLQGMQNQGGLNQGITKL